MIRYYDSVPNVIELKDGRKVKVLNFEPILDIEDDEKIYKRLSSSDLLRADKISKELYGNSMYYEAVLMFNNESIFDWKEGDKILVLSPDILELMF